MADNVTLPGTGTVVAADDVSSVWYQQVKLVDGTLNSTAAIAGDATYGLDVDVTRIADGADATQGVTTGAAVITDAAGTLQQYLRGLVKLAITAGSFLVRATVASGGVASGAVASGAIASGAVASGAVAAGAIAAGAAVAGAFVDGADLTQGALADAAVVTDASGSVSAKLRGIIKLLVDKITVKGTGFSIPVTLTVTNGAYTIGDVVGGLITFANMVSANGKHAIINTVTLGGVVAIAYELWFMSADIATPAADNAAFTLVAADEALVRGVLPISTADYNAAASAFNVATARGAGLEVQAGAATTSVYAYLKATATTSPGTTTLYLRVTGEMVD